SKVYISNREALPIRDTPCKLLQIDDEGLASDMKDYLQSYDKYVCAQDIVNYSNVAENQALHGFKKGISLTTAQWWMKKFGYHWTKDLKGQYVDGHEHQDIVHYCQNIFLLAWIYYQPQIQKWREDDSTFYANNRRKQHWVHDSEGAVPQPKGEGTSLMVADFISADYRFLCSKDGSESARVLFRAGKACNGYFTNQDITAHVAKPMSILEKDYSKEDHVLILNNACTHLKRADDALSARTMPK
ncbi:uncharacterized protein EDB93DRAFT_1084808, partial [Suillus bovinus]|uniref:uncharacterized protein n=1 Tax=Suillus bovinus TaxID=48563 RepID=UPI001B86923D